MLGQGFKLTVGPQGFSGVRLGGNVQLKAKGNHLARPTWSCKALEPEDACPTALTQAEGAHAMRNPFFLVM